MGFDLKRFLTPGGFKEEWKDFKYVDPLLQQGITRGTSLEDKGLSKLWGGLGSDSMQQYHAKDADNPARGVGHRLMAGAAYMGGSALGGMFGGGGAGAGGGSAGGGMGGFDPSQLAGMFGGGGGQQSGGSDIARQRLLAEQMRERARQRQQLAQAPGMVDVSYM